MFKSRLLLNGMPVFHDFHENFFKIRCSRVIRLVASNVRISFAFSFFCYEGPLLCRRTELQSGFYERAPWDSLCYRVFVQRRGPLNISVIYKNSAFG